MSNEKEDKDVKISDIFKKVVNTSVNAAFMGEETIKNILNDLPLPKDIANGLVQNAKTSKDEFIKSIKKEFKTYLNNIDISKEVDRILDNYDIDVNANITFKKKKKPASDDSKK
jgi:hypothetical protein